MFFVHCKYPIPDTNTIALCLHSKEFCGGPLYPRLRYGVTRRFKASSTPVHSLYTLYSRPLPRPWEGGADRYHPGYVAG